MIGTILLAIGLVIAIIAVIGAVMAGMAGAR